jgi:hypothetical protein
MPHAQALRELRWEETGGQLATGAAPPETRIEIRVLERVLHKKLREPVTRVDHACSRRK